MFVRCLLSLGMIAVILGLAPTLSAADTKPLDERGIALWVLRQGGSVQVAGADEYTNDPFELPAGTIRIAGVDMHGTVLDPKELEPLRALDGLRELLIPAR